MGKIVLKKGVFVLEKLKYTVLSIFLFPEKNRIFISKRYKLFSNYL
jgi:hypothetical protein